MSALYPFSSLSVAEVAVQYPSSLALLREFHIDFCCGGKTSFAEACQHAGADPVTIWEKIQRIATAQPGLHVEHWPETMLMDFIEANHHRYVRTAIPEISELLTTVCSVHGQDHPELLTVKLQFSELAEELLQHMVKEEQILFPAVREMVSGQQPEAYENAFLEQPMAVMEIEHERAGALIKSIRDLTLDYTAPATACPTYQITYKKLQQFDEDLMQHVHLENNVLFQKVRSVLA
jgi:regulator of cell morphogenesis and NO signaling